MNDGYFQAAQVELLQRLHVLINLVRQSSTTKCAEPEEEEEEEEEELLDQGSSRSRSRSRSRSKRRAEQEEQTIPSTSGDVKSAESHTQTEQGYARGVRHWLV